MPTNETADVLCTQRWADAQRFSDFPLSFLDSSLVGQNYRKDDLSHVEPIVTLTGEPRFSLGLFDSTKTKQRVREDRAPVRQSIVERADAHAMLQHLHALSRLACLYQRGSHRHPGLGVTWIGVHRPLEDGDATAQLSQSALTTVMNSSPWV